ncbi:helix-turn-helix domain-containing protein [Granulicella sp. L46]|jgi:DNA-binding HxlR family transcriptional regulator|uniref:winged helix-turn-helix transcriptional regulator n=1 Tax=Granulicella sp. L46 TaxID=1641865 RepID=UPI001C208D85
MGISYTERVARVVELLRGKWTVQILCAMREHPVRLSKLKGAIPPTSKKALTASLRSLEAAGAVLRRDLSSSVLHVEYELADTMQEPLVALLDHLAEWDKLNEQDRLGCDGSSQVGIAVQNVSGALVSEERPSEAL